MSVEDRVLELARYDAVQAWYLQVLAAGKAIDSAAYLGGDPTGNTPILTVSGRNVQLSGMAYYGAQQLGQTASQWLNAQLAGPDWAAALNNPAYVYTPPAPLVYPATVVAPTATPAVEASVLNPGTSGVVPTTQAAESETPTGVQGGGTLSEVVPGQGAVQGTPTLMAAMQAMIKAYGSGRSTFNGHEWGWFFANSTVADGLPMGTIELGLDDTSEIGLSEFIARFTAFRAGITPATITAVAAGGTNALIALLVAILAGR